MRDAVLTMLQDGTDVDADFSVLSARDLLSRSVDELKELVAQRRNMTEEERKVAAATGAAGAAEAKDASQAWSGRHPAAVVGAEDNTERQFAKTEEDRAAARIRFVKTATEVMRKGPPTPKAEMTTATPATRPRAVLQPLPNPSRPPPRRESLIFIRSSCLERLPIRAA